MIFISWAITTQPSFRTHFKVLHIHILTVFYGCDEQLSLDLRKVPFSIFKKLQFTVDTVECCDSTALLIYLSSHVFPLNYSPTLDQRKILFQIDFLLSYLSESIQLTEELAQGKFAKQQLVKCSIFYQIAACLSLFVCVQV